MKYLEDLLNKIKRHVSGYKSVHISVSVHFSSFPPEIGEVWKEWERFVGEYNLLPEKSYSWDGRVGDIKFARDFYFTAKTQIAGLKVTAFSPHYPNPDFNQKSWDERQKKRQHCSEMYQEFLKEKKELGCFEQ